MRARIILLLAATCALPTTAQPESFDCSKASSEAERIICSDDLVSRTDDLLNDAFARALYASKQPRKLRADQTLWLRTKRDACRDVGCLRAEYASRTAELEALASGATRATDLKPFRHLNSYGGKFPWDVLNDEVLRASIKRLVGIHFERLESNLQVSDGVTIDTAGALETEGCRPHNCKNEAAKIYIGQNGRIFVALLTDSDRLMYFTNDKYNTERIIDPIKRFVDQTPEARVVLMNR